MSHFYFDVRLSYKKTFSQFLVIPILSKQNLGLGSFGVGWPKKVQVQNSALTFISVIANLIDTICYNFVFSGPWTARKVPNRAVLKTDRMHDQHQRTVMVGHATLEDLMTDLIQENINKCQQFFIRFGKTNDDILKGHLELRFGSVSEAKEIAASLQGMVRDEITVQHLNEEILKSEFSLLLCFQLSAVCLKLNGAMYVLLASPIVLYLNAFFLQATITKNLQNWERTTAGHQVSEIY